LNINTTLNNGQGREALVDDVLGELTSISFRDWMGAMRRWHEGALSLVHLNVLMLLKSHGPLPMSRLAEMLDVSVASATGIIDRMESRGIVERHHAEGDRRVVEVHLTQPGSAIFTSMDSERRNRLSKLIDGMSDDELGALLTGLRAFRAARERILSETPGVRA
jgi:DNA-binding MarR family transcriptional regulator